jgi:hypothetical protein
MGKYKGTKEGRRLGNSHGEGHPAILTDALLVQEREICVIHQSRSLEPADHGHGR